MSRARRRWAAGLATLLLLADIAAWATTAVLAAQDEPVDLSAASYVLSFLVFPLVGWLIAVRIPRNPLGWIYLAFSAFGAVGTVVEELAPVMAYSGHSAAAVALIQGGGWLYSLGITLVLGPGVLLFPNGRLVDKRWRSVLWGFAGLMLLGLIFELFGTSPVCVDPIWEGGLLTGCALQLVNPLRLQLIERLNTGIGLAVQPLLALAVILSLVGLVMRYRRAGGEVRQQVKWVVFVAALGIVPLLLITIARTVLEFTAIDLLDVVLLTFLEIGLPVAIGIAIFRYRLYDIDRIISRTTAYAIVVGLLAAVYAATVTLAQQLLPFQNQLGVVVSTLVVAALFNPLRQRVQSSVNRRFNRSKYDAQRVLDELSSHLREDVDLELMQSALLEAARQTMQPSHLSLWVRGPTSNE